MGVVGKPRSKKAVGDMTGQEVATALNLPLESIRLLPRFVVPLLKRNGAKVHQYYRLEQFTPEATAGVRNAAKAVIARKTLCEPLRFAIRGYWGTGGYYNSAHEAIVWRGRWMLTIDGAKISGRGLRFRLDLADGRVLDVHHIQRGE